MCKSICGGVEDNHNILLRGKGVVGELHGISPRQKQSDAARLLNDGLRVIGECLFNRMRDFSNEWIVRGNGTCYKGSGRK